MNACENDDTNRPRPRAIPESALARHMPFAVGGRESSQRAQSEPELPQRMAMSAANEPNEVLGDVELSYAESLAVS